MSRELNRRRFHSAWALQKRRIVEYDGKGDNSGCVLASARKLSAWSCTDQLGWAAYCARSAARSAALIESWLPASLRRLRFKTPIGSCRSRRARYSHRSIVETPKRTGSPVLGWRHCRAASFCKLAAQGARGRRRGQQVSDHREAQLRPALMDP